MGRKRLPDTTVYSIRMSKAIWNLVREVAEKEDRTLNGQVRKIVKDWLVERGHLKEGERSTLG